MSKLNEMKGYQVRQTNLLHYRSVDIDPMSVIAVVDISKIWPDYYDNKPL